MYQWTLPSQGLLSQNVEAVFDVPMSLGMLAHPEVLPGVFLPSPRMGSTLARVSCLGVAPRWVAVIAQLSRTLD
ncbi:hypothetical protein [Corynebacterium stationis]|uniref:hypothetical protein n=1 Tax=Corynebacterium stationis TaxID=1705 RepID=UPI0028AF06B9|nr:hypothetical protein [Corynebacterium stationis]